MYYKLLFIILVCCISCNYTRDLNLKPTDRKRDISTEDKYARELKMYPRATSDTIRHVIYLPKKEMEYNYKVGIYIGYFMEIDCNYYNLMGKVETKIADGWGFHYYQFQTNGIVSNTLKGCPDGSTRREFVHAPSELIYYNSRLPIVVYTPKKYEVKYKLWTTDGQFKDSIQE